MLRKWHQAAVAVLPTGDGDPARRLFALFTVGNLVRGLADGALVFPVEQDRVVMVVGREGEAPYDFDALKRVLDAALDAPVALGVGSMAEGLDGLRRSYAEATRAANCHPFLGAQQTLYYQDLGTVERDPGDLITFCWPGPIRKVGPNRFVAACENFTPTSELTVYFVHP